MCFSDGLLSGDGKLCDVNVWYFDGGYVPSVGWLEYGGGLSQVGGKMYGDN